MNTYTITTDGLESTQTTHAYKITYPAGHWMGNDLQAEIVVRGRPHRVTTIDSVAVNPEMDAAVICEPIEIQYPEFVEGGMGEPRFVQADKERVMGILTGMFARGEVQ